MGANDGVKRGDRADTGDLEAQPKEGVSRSGSGVDGGEGGNAGQPTAIPSSMGGGDKPRSRGDVDAGDDAELTVRDENDPSLGLGDGPEG